MARQIVAIQLIDSNGNIIKANCTSKKQAIKRMRDEIFYTLEMVYQDIISSDMVNNAAYAAFNSLFDREEENECARPINAGSK